MTTALVTPFIVNTTSSDGTITVTRDGNKPATAAPKSDSGIAA